MIARASFTGLVLAGGLSRRMQDDARAAGQDRPVSQVPLSDAVVPDREKGLALLHGVPLIAHVCRVLAPQVATLLISANRQVEQFAHYGQVIRDDPALGRNLGPLAGVLRGLTQARTPWLAVMPVDVPGAPPDMVLRLAQAAQSQQAPAAYVVTTEQGESRAHPLCMVVRSSFAANLRDYLQHGDRKVFLWMTRIGATPVHFDEGEHAFANINTLEDLRRAGIISRRGTPPA